MRINHNIASMIGQGALSSQHAALGKSLEKLSTGLRINRAADDAAGLSVSESLRAKVRGLGQGRSNAQDGLAMVQVAEGAIAQMGDALQRMRELAIQAANDTYVTSDRISMEREFDGLMDEISRMSDAATFNGVSLLTRGGQSIRGSATNGSSLIHIGLGSASAAGGMDIAIPPMTLDDLGVHLNYYKPGPVFSDNIDIPNGITTGVRPFFRNSYWAATMELAHSASQNSNEAIDHMDIAIKSVNSARSTLGAYMNRLESAIASMSNEIYNTQDAESRIRDTDFAAETTAFTRSQILAQSATSMLAQANQVPRGALALLNA